MILIDKLRGLGIKGKTEERGEKFLKGVSRLYQFRLKFLLCRKA